jgi:hypothetical protein
MKRGTGNGEWGTKKKTIRAPLFVSRHVEQKLLETRRQKHLKNMELRNKK